MDSQDSGRQRALRRLAVIARHLSPANPPSTGVRSSTVAASRDPLLENSATGFSRMKADRRISDVGPSHTPDARLSAMVPIQRVRFSQSSLGSGFSSPPSETLNVPLAVSLRSANPLSVLTEAPGRPSALMVRNEDEPSLTTFDHRRLVNSALHAPATQVEARVTDKSEIPPREFGKYTTTTRGESINVFAPSALNPHDPRRNLGSLSVFSGPDTTLQMNTRRALSHMIQRESVLAELTHGKSPDDHQRHTTRKREYQERLRDFSALHAHNPKL